MTIDQLKTNLQDSRPDAEWTVNYSDRNNVLYTDIIWLDQGQSKPSAQDLSF